MPPDQAGFTLVEMVVALALSTIVFVALAAALGGGLRALAVQKARTQGNEVATQGIEDLQRLGFDYLAVCGTPPAPVPADFSTPATLPNCPSPLDPSTFARPCGTPPVLGSIPSMSYVCRRTNIDFNVRRYIAWADAAQTTKRMAVFVDWTDSAGPHTVSQQSSLRAPSEAAVIGLTPPAFVSVSVSGGVTKLNPDGSLQAGELIALSAVTTGLSDQANDKVSVTFNTLQEGSPVAVSMPLLASGIDSWTATIDPSNGYKFGTGSQFFIFTGTRASDGKGNSRVATDIKKLCPTSDDCSVSNSVPRIVSTSVPSTVDIDPAGALVSPTGFSVSVVTERVTNNDRVDLTFQTQTGAYTVLLKPDSACSLVPGDLCGLWLGSVTQGDSLRFPAGPQKFYFTASQIVNPPIDIGSTAAAASSGTPNFQ